MKEQIKQALEKITPFPWESMNGRDIFSQAGAHNLAGIKADDNDGWHIADTMCGPTNVNGEEFYMCKLERDGNTHLIANAPTWLRWQNERIEQLEEVIETAISFLKGNELFIKAEQIKKMRDQALGKEE